jgi:cell division protease FtsH
MKFSWRVVALWSLLALVIGFFFWQGTFASVPANMGQNAANTRMTYGRFLEYLEADRVLNVDLYDGGRTAILEAADPDIENRIQRWRVDLPASAPELIKLLKEHKVSFDAHPMRNDGAIWGLLGNLVFPVLLITVLFVSSFQQSSWRSRSSDEFW